MSNLVPLPKSLPSALLDYLPTSAKSQQTTAPQQNDTQVSKATQPSSDLPFVTLTYATSLDSRISAAPGVQTIISHPETKTMTHYIRYHHDAILVGVGTVLADDPGLNCRWTPASDEVNSRVERSKETSCSRDDDKFTVSTTDDEVISPTVSTRNPDQVHLIQPIIVDPSFKWDPRGSRLIRTAEEGTGLAPYVVVQQELFSKVSNDTCVLEKIHALEQAGGKLIIIQSGKTESNDDKKDHEHTVSLSWKDIFSAIYKETTCTGRPIRSVMVEGGAKVINSLLDEASSDLLTQKSAPLISSIIITIGPVFLGSKGVSVSPVTSHPRVNHVRWWSGTNDAVLFGRLL